MLFKTVMGPEISSVFRYIKKRHSEGIETRKEDICSTFYPKVVDDNKISYQGINDALSFLVSAYLLKKEGRRYVVFPSLKYPSFRLNILSQLRKLELGIIPAIHDLDPIYMSIVNEIFCMGDTLYVHNLHSKVNQLKNVQILGGVSKEKITSWMRVMSYLGVGNRISKGFQCIYDPGLINKIIKAFDQKEAILQLFFEDHFSKFLPFKKENGDLFIGLKNSLIHLNKINDITLAPLQDSPTRSYFGENLFKSLEQGN